MTLNKKITQSIPILAPDFVDMEHSSDRIDEYHENLKKNSFISKVFLKYLPFRLHDSEIINFKFIKNQLSVTINDFATYIFASNLNKTKEIGIDYNLLNFPLIFFFSGRVKMEYFQVDENENLISSSELTPSEYLGEEILVFNQNRIKIAFELWHNSNDDNIPGTRFILIVTSDKFELKEEQDNAWNSLFGNNYDNYYSYYKNKFNSGRYCADDQNSKDLIEEIERLNSI